MRVNRLVEPLLREVSMSEYEMTAALIKASAIDQAISLECRAAQGGPAGSRVFEIPYPSRSLSFPLDSPAHPRGWSSR